MEKTARIIIDNRSDLSDNEVFSILTNYYIKEGKQTNSGKQYTGVMLITHKGKRYVFTSILNKKSERILIYNELK